MRWQGSSQENNNTVSVSSVFLSVSLCKFLKIVTHLPTACLPVGRAGREILRGGTEFTEY